MRTKITFVAFGVLATVTTAYLVWPEWFGFCASRMSVYGPVCSSPYGYPYGVLLFPFSLSLLVGAVFAFFTTRKTFKRWAWFSLWYGIVAAILMFLATAAVLDVGFLSIPLFDVEKVAYLLAGIYTALSVLILGISDFLVRRRG